MYPIKDFKKRWNNAEKIRENEVREMSLSDKIQKTDSIMRLGYGLGFKSRRSDDILSVQNIWVALKKNYP